MSKRIRKIRQTAVNSVLWTAHQALRARGFRWEVQHRGEVRLGLWRKTFRKKTLRKPFPTRLVFIPGFGDTPLSWLGVLTLIEPVLRFQFDEIVLVDFPGYNGRLAAEKMFASVDLVFDALFDVLDSLKPHTIMGHSLGGFMTTHYAASCSSGKRPNGKPETYRDLDAAIVIDPSGLFESDDERQAWRHKLDRLAQEGPMYWRPMIFAREPFWFKFFAGQFLEFLGREETVKFMNSGRAEHEVNAILPQIRTRMTLIWGENDKLLPSSQAEGWLKYLQNTKEPAHAVIIRGSGHTPQVEAPAATAAILGQVLSRRKPHEVGKPWYRLIQPR